MNFNPVDIANTIIMWAQKIPALGNILVQIGVGAGTLMTVVSGLVMVWHALIKMVEEIAKVPGLGSVQLWADKLKAFDENGMSFLNQWILPILDVLTPLNLPAKKPVTEAAKVEPPKV